MKTKERVALGLSVLTQSRRFSGGSDDWERGKTTYWEAFYKFIDAVCAILVPVFIQFPTGDRAKRCAREMQRMIGLPNIVACVDGTHIPITRPKTNQ